EPAVGADGDRAAELEAAAALFGAQRVSGSEHLDGRAEKGAVADLDAGDVEDDAVEVEVDAAAEADVRAVVAEERRLDEDVALVAEELGDDAAALVRLALPGAVKGEEEVAGAVALGDEVGVFGEV